ncbi:MAG: glycosyltransferase [Butyrivibrio sp.]|nr:glycosyltransferase [Butyrivibrio sp.]
MQLSIIVPVYNTECYLKRCIESLLKIQVLDYEILLIDDGSTDNSDYICDKYAKKYNEVRAFHKKMVELYLLG